MADESGGLVDTAVAPIPRPDDLAATERFRVWSAVLVVAGNSDALHAELTSPAYPFLNPGVEPGPGGGRQPQLIDPASNRLGVSEPAQ